LGGDEDWDYKYIEPIPGEDNAMADETAKQSLLKERAATVLKFEETTISWIKEAPAKDFNILGDLKRQRGELATSLRENYWKLDPYIRAKTFYDRMGLIGEGGIISFYPKVKATNGVATAASPTEPLRKVETSADDLD
jgi:hypothetical protein